MWQRRWDEAEQQAVFLSEESPMVPAWHNALDRLVTLRAEMRQISQALTCAERGDAPGARDRVAMRSEFDALMAAPKDAT
jgi:hypothetical protein